jgi:hypothetical protein
MYFLFVLLWHLGTKEDYEPLKRISLRDLDDNAARGVSISLPPSGEDFLNIPSSKLNMQVWLSLLASVEPTRETEQLL